MIPKQISKAKSLASLTSWQVGGDAEYYCEPVDIAELKFCVKWANQNNLPISILGGGTNVLISDLGIDGLVICLRKFSEVKTSVINREDGEFFEITCLAGTSKSELLKTYLRQKLAPALFLAGLPGDVGGGIVMNAGVGEAITPREFVEITNWIEVLRPDGMTVDRLKSSELKWSYRHCDGWKPGIVCRASLIWPNRPEDQVLERVRAANQKRLLKQPLDMPSCGSTFINPPGHKAGQLIEMSGFKGFTVGGAQVSQKHANFIVNLGGATASDIRKTILAVKDGVLKKTGVQLQTEVVFLGRWES